MAVFGRSMIFSHLLHLCLLLSLLSSAIAVAPGKGEGYTINGRVKIAGLAAKGFGLPVKVSNAKVILNGGQQITFLKPDGYFSLLVSLSSGVKELCEILKKVKTLANSNIIVDHVSRI